MDFYISSFDLLKGAVNFSEGLLQNQRPGITVLLNVTVAAGSLIAWNPIVYRNIPGFTVDHPSGGIDVFGIIVLKVSFISLEDWNKTHSVNEHVSQDRTIVSIGK